MFGRLGIALAIALAACAPSVPTPAEQQRAVDRADADRLAAAVAALPGVTFAHAELSRAVADPLAPGRVLPSPADAAIVIIATAEIDAASTTQAAKALAAIAGARDARITLSVAHAVASQPLARVGPFDVAAGSATRVRVTLLVLLGVIAAGAASVIARYLRRGNRPQ